MQVILKEEVKSLGHAGEVVSVKDGYARNFLIPKGIAIEANPKNVKALEQERKKIQDLVRKERAKAEELASRISSVSLVIKAKSGEDDKLFGSVTAVDIADSLKNEGIEIDKRKIVLDEPIKRLGDYTVSVKLYTEVAAQLNIQVVSE